MRRILTLLALAGLLGVSTRAARAAEEWHDFHKHCCHPPYTKRCPACYGGPTEGGGLTERAKCPTMEVTYGTALVLGGFTGSPIGGHYYSYYGSFNPGYSPPGWTPAKVSIMSSSAPLVRRVGYIGPGTMAP